MCLSPQVPLVSLSQYKLVLYRTFAKKNIFYTRRSSVDCLSMNDLGHATPYVYSLVGREMCSQASPSGVLKTVNVNECSAHRCVRAWVAWRRGRPKRRRHSMSTYPSASARRHAAAAAWAWQGQQPWPPSTAAAGSSRPAAPAIHRVAASAT